MPNKAKLSAALFYRMMLFLEKQSRNPIIKYEKRRSLRQTTLSGVRKVFKPNNEHDEVNINDELNKEKSKIIKIIDLSLAFPHFYSFFSSLFLLFSSIRGICRNLFSQVTENFFSQEFIFTNGAENYFSQEFNFLNCPCFPQSCKNFFPRKFFPIKKFEFEQANDCWVHKRQHFGRQGLVMRYIVVF